MRGRRRCSGSSLLAMCLPLEAPRERLIATPRRSPGRRRGKLSSRHAFGFLAMITLSAIGCASGSDVVGPSHDVVQTGTASRPADGYEYVAKRSLAVVGLAEARGI